KLYNLLLPTSSGRNTPVYAAIIREGCGGVKCCIIGARSSRPTIRGAFLITIKTEGLTMYVPYDMSKVKVLDLSQNFSMDSPPFAFYEGPTIKWVKKIAFEGVNAQHISSTNHIATHLDSPYHFYDPGPDISGIPIDTLFGT